MLPPLQPAATANWRKVRRPIPPIIGAASTRGRNFRGGKPRGHPKPQRGGCSPPTALQQAFPSRLRSEAVQPSGTSNLRHANLQWQIPPQEQSTTLRLPGVNKKQVSQSGLQL
jgi:hypothetical protein